MIQHPSREGLADNGPGPGKPVLQSMYLRMLQIRAFEEEIQYHFSRSLIHGTTHLYVGEEAVAVGAMANLTDQDYITSTHRGHGHAIAKGTDLNLMMAEMFGKRHGCCKGKGGSMHIADTGIGNLGANGIVGGGIPIAVGAALSIRLLGQDRVAISFFGDGATNEGVFHEAVNLASVWKLPVIFICENNHYGVSTHINRSMNITDITDRARSYGIPGWNVDGMDVLAVYETIRKAREHAVRSGPVLVVAETYRFLGHSKSDTNRYRTSEEVMEWRKRDPIPRFRSRLLEDSAFTEAELKGIEERARKDVEAAVLWANSDEDPVLEDLLEDVYAE